MGFILQTFHFTFGLHFTFWQLFLSNFSYPEHPWGPQCQPVLHLVILFIWFKSIFKAPLVCSLLELISTMWEMPVTSYFHPCGLEPCILVQLVHPPQATHTCITISRPLHCPQRWNQDPELSAHQLIPAGTSMGPAEPRPGSRNNCHTEDPAAFGAAFPLVQGPGPQRSKSDRFHAADSKFCFPTSEYNKWLLSYLTWS